jgi:hypothetical protein
LTVFFGEPLHPLSHLLYAHPGDSLFNHNGLAAPPVGNLSSVGDELGINLTCRAEGDHQSD